MRTDRKHMTIMVGKIVNEIIQGIPSRDRQNMLVCFEGHKTPKAKENHVIKDKLDYIRVCIKYLFFDLEAAHRENIYLKKLLEESKEG